MTRKCCFPEAKWCDRSYDLGAWKERGGGGLAGTWRGLAWGACIGLGWFQEAVQGLSMFFLMLYCPCSVIFYTATSSRTHLSVHISHEM